MTLSKKTLLLVACVPFLFSSCATIFGGSNYVAHVTVVDNPKANIIYKGKDLGNGQVKFKVPRKESDKFSFMVKEEGCQEQVFKYINRTFRGWALAGSLVTFTTYFIPFGGIVDLANGAYWKPDIFEKGVSKIDYNNYTYSVYYPGCNKTAEKVEENQMVIQNDAHKVVQVVDNSSKTVIAEPLDPSKIETYEVKPVSKLVDVIYLKNGSVIKGDIIEYTTDSFVKIQMPDGNIFNFNSNQIARIARELN